MQPGSNQFERPSNGQERLSGSLVPVLVLTGIFFGNFSARLMTGPLLPAMEKDLGLTHFQSGGFVLMIGVGLFCGQMITPFLAGRRGYRFCILVSMFGAAVCTGVISVLQTKAFLYPAFILLGMTGGIYIPTGISLITSLVDPRDWGKTLSIHELAPNLALILVPFLATAAVTTGSWRTAFGSVTLLLLILAVIYCVWGKDASRRPQPPTRHHFRKVMSIGRFWLMVLLLSLGICLETGVYTMVPLYLVSERGYLLADANALLGLSRLPGLFMVLAAGWISDRLSPGITMTLVLGVNGIVILIMALGPDPVVAPAIIIQGAATACLFPPLLSAASSITSEENKALSLSLSLAIAPIVGGGIIPAFIAWTGDTLSFSVGLGLTGLISFAGIGLTLMLKRSTPDNTFHETKEVGSD